MTGGAGGLSAIPARRRALSPGRPTGARTGCFFGNLRDSRCRGRGTRSVRRSHGRRRSRAAARRRRPFPLQGAIAQEQDHDYADNDEGPEPGAAVLPFRLPGSLAVTRMHDMSLASCRRAGGIMDRHDWRRHLFFLLHRLCKGCRGSLAPDEKRLALFHRRVELDRPAQAVIGKDIAQARVYLG